MADWQNNLRSHSTFNHNFGASFHPSRSRIADTDRHRSTASPTFSTPTCRAYAHTTYTHGKNDYSNTLSPTSYGDQDRQRLAHSPIADAFSKLDIQDKNGRAKSPMMAAGREGEEDPRTEIRKACEALKELKKIDLEAMERKYRSLMESVEPDVLSKEELYANSHDSSKTKSSSKETEERLRRERDELRNKVAELQAKVEEERGKQSQIQQKYTDQAIREIDDLRMKLQEEEEKILKRKTQFEDAISKFNEKEKELENQNAVLVEQLDSLKEMVRKLEREKKDAEREKTDALTRLSKEMGTKLNERNPNIADLSDSNRPTKLAEKYSELYDNEWTDALEQLCDDKMGEEAAIKVLLQIVQSSYQFCKDVAANQIRDVESALSSLSKDRWAESVVSASVTKLVKECQKEMRMETKDVLYNEYIKSSASSRFASKIPDYVKKCLSLCWRMVIQDPQVIFGKLAEAGDTFDPNTYKEYTKTGSIVSYTVWLPMILHEKGPLLCKGTAQPIPSKVPQRSKSAGGRSSGRKETDVDATSTRRPATTSTVYTSHQREKPTETDVDALFESDPRKTVSSKQREKHVTPESMGVSSYESSRQHSSYHGNQGQLGYPAESWRNHYGTGPNLVRFSDGRYVYYFDGRIFSQREWDMMNNSFLNPYQGSSYA